MSALAPSPAVLRLQAVTKRFGTLVANDSISLDLHAGEVLALLGENGAGKSTLVSILFGHYLADEGSIEAFGEPLPPGQPRAALERGIGMVHQHFTLADNLSVLDNVMLGTEPLWQPFSRRTAARERLLDAALRFGLQVDPDARIGSLSVGERQRVEILKALVRGARILILDEPTAVLTPQESQSLFATLRQMVEQGLSVIFISHKLDEVLQVAHRIAVLRAGALVATMPAAGADKATLAEAMVGRRVEAPRRAAGTLGAPAAGAAPACELCGIGVAGRASGDALRSLDLVVWPGEIVAVAGVAGNGQQRLVELLCGLCAPDQGTLQVGGHTLPARPRAFVEAGVARVPEDRHAIGVVGDLPLWENAILERYRERVFSRWGWLRRGAAMAHAREIVRRFDVRGTESGGLQTPARRLSGGNMQKLILGRALARPRPPVLIVASQPTWGLDVGAVAYVHQQLLDACAAGSGVLLVSEDLDEVFAIADRVAVMHHGRLTAALPVADWSLARIGLAMAGAAPAPGQEDARAAAATA
jgi:simple sugar transport system ATP-binding protein